MPTPDEIRKKIQKLLTEKNIDLAAASRAIGKNQAYIQQYIVKGSPVILKDTDRKIIANMLEVDEKELMDSKTLKDMMKIHNLEKNVIKTEYITIDIVDATACCGVGIENFQENVIGQWNMPLLEYRTISTTSAPDNVKMIRVKGDSMVPTIKDGDWALVDTSFRAPDSDGIYLLKISTGLAIKRLQGSVGNNITIISDNPKYPPVTASSGEILICGKIIYTLSAEKIG